MATITKRHTPWGRAQELMPLIKNVAWVRTKKESGIMVSINFGEKNISHLGLKYATLYGNYYCFRQKDAMLIVLFELPDVLQAYCDLFSHDLNEMKARVDKKVSYRYKKYYHDYLALSLQEDIQSKTKSDLTIIDIKDDRYSFVKDVWKVTVRDQSQYWVKGPLLAEKLISDCIIVNEVDLPPAQLRFVPYVEMLLIKDMEKSIETKIQLNMNEAMKSYWDLYLRTLHEQPIDKKFLLVIVGELNKWKKEKPLLINNFALPEVLVERFIDWLFQEYMDQD